MKIENLKPFIGQHCETTATGTLLKHLNFDLTEPMLFGIGEGLSFIFWNMKTMDFPFIGGRIKPDALTLNIVKNLNLELITKETVSPQKAWNRVKDLIDNGQLVGLKLDCFHLEYFSKPIHFAAHYVAMYGYDDKNAYLIDTDQQGGLVKTSLKSLALARSEKGVMSSKNLYYVIHQKNIEIDLKTAILNAIKNNATEYLNPPISNIAYRGIIKTSAEIIKWFKKSKDPKHEFQTTAMLMEKAGTGGALFRNLYRDFLKESYNLLKIEKLRFGFEAFKEIAELWLSISHLLEKVENNKDIDLITKASFIMKEIAAKEKKAMEILISI